MRTKATRMAILMRCAGVPAPALSPNATVLECDIYRSTPADWEWLDGYAAQRRRVFTRHVRLRQAALRPFCGKSLISS